MICIITCAGFWTVDSENIKRCKKLRVLVNVYTRLEQHSNGIVEGIARKTFFPHGRTL